MTDQKFVDMAGQTDLIEAQIGQMVQDMKTGTARMLRSECSRRGKIVSIKRVIANSLTDSGSGTVCRANNLSPTYHATSCGQKSE